jgi:hypothetical protein
MRGVRAVVGQENRLYNQRRKEHQMDNSRFDRLTRQVGRQTDRRSMFKTAAGGALALLGLGAAGRGAGAQSGFEGSRCFTTADCGEGLVCEGVTPSFISVLIGEGYGPPSAAGLFGPNPGTCRFRSGDNCAHSGQECRSTDDCCNGLNLVCHNDTCQRRN